MVSRISPSLHQFSGSSLSDTINSNFHLPSRVSVRKPKNPYIEELKVHEARLNQHRQKDGASSLNQTWSSKKSYNDAGSLLLNSKPLTRNTRSRQTIGRSRIGERKTWNDSSPADIDISSMILDEDNDEEVIRYDVQVQVQPRISESSTQASDGISLEAMEVASKQNEQLTEENFSMRRMLEDLRYRLAEVEYERNHLADELANVVQISTQTPQKSVDLISEECQTDMFPAENLPVLRKYSQSELLVNEPRPIFPDEISEENALDNVVASFDRNAVEIIQATCRAHLERKRFLNEMRNKQFDENIGVIQSVFRAHLERKRFLGQVSS